MTHRAGTIGLAYTRGKAGGVIRVAQEGHWNHVVVAKGDGQCFSAEPRGGVQLRPEDFWDDVVWLVNEPFTDAQGLARVRFCESKLGAGYNFPAILTFSRWWLPVPQWFLRWANNRPEVICSELAVQAAIASGTPWFPADRLPCTVAPTAIDIEFRRHGW